MRLALPDGIMPAGEDYDANRMEGTGMGSSSQSEEYVLRGGRAGAERLRVLNRVKWPTTEPLLRVAGLRAGMSCLDVGCGSGDVTLKMAALVGAEGHVVGIDRDQSILHLARQEADEQGLPVTFRAVEAEELVEESAYDLVFSRYLLSHLPRPQRALEAMVRAVRPGGRLVLEDVYFPGHVCYPPNAALDRFVELYQAVARAKEGGDAAIGVRLLEMALEAGLEEVRVGLVVPTFREGEGKWVTQITMEHIREPVVDAGLASDADVDDVVGELGRIAVDDRTLMSIAPTFQVWGLKAGA
jgi:SAM-dependent methyltransferase